MRKELDFIGIGTPKCGTDWLVECLREHPGIDFAKHKEPNFYLSPDSGLYSFVFDHMRIKTKEAYLEEFTWEKGKKHGEFSIQYIFDTKALKKIKIDHPDVKVIIALRDPVAFLYSIYWYMKYSNIYHLVPDTFEEGIKTKNTEFPFHKKYARFYHYTKNAFDIFGKENVLVVLLDDIKEDQGKVLKRVFEFIGVKKSYKPEALGKHVNKTKQVRSPVLMKVINKIMKFVVLIKMDKMLNDIMNTNNPIKRIYKKVVHVDKGYPPIDPKTEKKLRKEFDDEINQLAKLINRDLSAWKAS